MWKILLPATLVSLVSGCATNGPAINPAPVIVDNSCAWAKPIYISKQDKLTDGTADQILAHNLAGAGRCGWKPTSQKK